MQMNLRHRNDIHDVAVTLYTSIVPHPSWITWIILLFRSIEKLKVELKTGNSLIYNSPYIDVKTVTHYFINLLRKYKR